MILRPSRGSLSIFRRKNRAGLIPPHPCPGLPSPIPPQHQRCIGIQAGVEEANKGDKGTIVRQLSGGQAGQSRLLQRAAHTPPLSSLQMDHPENLGAVRREKNKWGQGTEDSGRCGVPRLSSARNTEVRQGACT